MDDDELLLHELRRAAELADPVPARLITAASAAFTWRTFEAELAELVFDSTAEEAGALVRSSGTHRALSFRAAALTLELETTRAGDSLHLTGQLTPAAVTDIEIVSPPHTVEVRTDGLGRFRAVISPAGPLRLRIAAPPGTDHAIETGWI